MSSGIKLTQASYTTDCLFSAHNRFVLEHETHQDLWLLSVPADFFFFASLMLHAISPASLVYTRIPLSCLSVWHQVAINLNPQGTAKLKVPAMAPSACFRQRLPSRWPV